jgi:hypothetical protein
MNPSQPIPSSPAEYLANELERLMALPIATPEDVEMWDSERWTIDQTLADKFPGFEAEHEVEHFSDDVDMRARDAGYRDYQHGLMSDYVRRLRGG